MTEQVNALLSCGYSRQDILDLVALFETQIKLLTSNLSSLREDSISAEIHKLKGGCELLSFTHEATELTLLNKAPLSNIKKKNELMTLLNKLVKELASIRTIVNSSKK